MSIVSRAELEKKAAAGAKKAAASAVDKAKDYADDLVKKAEAKSASGMQSAVAKLTDSKVGGIRISDRLTKVAGSKLSSLKNKKLASPFFEQGPKTETLTQDVTGVTEALALINKSSDAGPLGSLMGPLAELTKGVGRDLKSLATDVLSSAASGIKIDKDNLKDRVKSLVSSDRLLSGLSQNMQNSLGSTEGLGSQISQIVDVTVGGISGQISSDKMAAVQGIAGVINQITKNDTISSVMDVGAKTSLVSGLMGEAIDLNLPNVVGAFTQAFQGDNVVQQALLANIGNILTKTDAASVTQAIETVGADRIMTVLPQAPALLAAGCSIPADTKANDYGVEFDSFVSNLEALSPEWRTADFGDTPVSDLTVFVTASDDLYALLTAPTQTDIDLKIDAVLGRSVELEDMSSVIQRSIPNVPGYAYA